MKLCSILVLGLFLFVSSSDAQDTSPTEASPLTEQLAVSKIMDGDSFKLTNGQTVQLAGIRTPELHDTPKLPGEAKRFKKEVWQFRTLGDEAEKISKKILSQSSMRMLIDTSTQAFDDNGNLLGFIYVPVEQFEDGAVPDGEIFIQRGSSLLIFLNAYLLKLGLAEVAEPLDPKYADLFLRLESEAKNTKKGLWS